MFLPDSLLQFIVTHFACAANTIRRKSCRFYLQLLTDAKQHFLCFADRGLEVASETCFNPYWTAQTCFSPGSKHQAPFFFFSDPFVKFRTSRSNFCPAYSLTWILLAAKLHVVSLARDVEQKKAELTPSCLRVQTSGINKDRFHDLFFFVLKTGTYPERLRNILEEQALYCQLCNNEPHITIGALLHLANVISVIHITCLTFFLLIYINL